MWGTRRFGELKSALDGVSQLVLTARLRHLEDIGLVDRTIFLRQKGDGLFMSSDVCHPS
jgi:DNA-binding HxlR family transcriptional regulator